MTLDSKIEYLRENRSTLAYRAILFFAVVYFLRPEDFIPGLSLVPISKITGAIALIALVFGTKAENRQKLPAEMKVLIALLLHMILTIPFAFWRGGALDIVINKFSKGVIIALLIVFVVTSLKELRKLIYVQCASIALVTFVSLLVHNVRDGRLNGIQKGILENPNDLAINIAINFPLCVAFMLAAKGVVRKSVWALGIAFLMYGVIATYSRSGLIAMVITCVICLWEFALKGRRPVLLIATAGVAFIGVAVMMSTRNYVTRIESMVQGNIKGSRDHGSLDERKELLKTSLGLMAKHPIFGIGPGNFPSYTGSWLVAHNTYTELGAEAGLPGLFLFLLLLALSARKIKAVRKLPGYKESAEIRLWTTAFFAGLAAYMAGAMFASTEYNLFPYFLVGYICALHHIAKTTKAVPTPTLDSRTEDQGDLQYGPSSKRQLVLSR